MKSANRAFYLVGVVMAACVGWSMPAAAQEQVPTFEISPYAAYRMGGTFDEKDGAGRVELNDSSAEGILFNMAARPNGQYELMYARQRTDAETSGFFANDPGIDMDVEYLQFGGTYLFDGEKARPFIAMTVGASRFANHLGGVLKAFLGDD